MDKNVSETSLELFLCERTLRIKTALLSETLTLIEDDRKRIVALEKLRDDLTNMIVHDLKNPLAGIMGTLDLFLSGALGEFKGDQLKFLKNMQFSSKRLINLIMDLLQIKKMEDGNVVLNRAKVKCGDFVASVSWLADLAKRESKSLNIDYDSDLELFIDADLIARVIENLVSNAIKHTGKEGIITVNIKKIEEGALFEVVDTGEGIPEEYLDRVFDKFFKVEQQQLKGKLDTGLGLAFCKLVVDAHGGKIGVESKIGSGSRFYFNLPC